MGYVVRWMKGRSIVAEERFERLQDARESALDMLPFYQDRLGATYVVVSGDNDVVYLRIY